MNGSRNGEVKDEIVEECEVIIEVLRNGIVDVALCRLLDLCDEILRAFVHSSDYSMHVPDSRTSCSSSSGRGEMGSADDEASPL